MQSEQDIHGDDRSDDDEDESDRGEAELYFEIKLAKYRHALELTLTFDNFKTEFRDFVSRYALNRDESLTLKEIVKTRISEQIQKQNKKKVKKARRKTATKLFSTQVDTQNQFHTSNSLISSIHSHSSEQSSGQMIQNNHLVGQISAKQQTKNQKHMQNSHNYIQSVPNQQHVSFNDFYGKTVDVENEKDELNDGSAIPKGVNIIKNAKQASNQLFHQNTKGYQNYFTLSHQKQSPLQNPKTPIIKLIDIFTPVKNNSPLKKGYLSPKIYKNIKSKQIPQSTKIQSTHYNKDSSISKSDSKKHQAKSAQSKKQKQKYNKQKQVIREIFYRLHREETTSWVQRKRPEPKSAKQRQDEKVVLESVMSHRKKYRGISEEEKQEIFTKLHFTSTESSMNRKTQFKGSDNYSNQIEHVIDERNKKNQRDQKRNAHFKKKQIDLSKSLYVGHQKRCNAHCQKHEEEKRRMQEAKQRLERQEQMRKKVRSRSKDGKAARSQGRSESKTKIFGSCECCHKQKIYEQEKRKEQERVRSYKRSYKKSSKYSFEKRFLPTNISFISDVLEESYNELFPN